MVSAGLALLVAVGQITHAAAQTDGNPHQWDRTRRCDEQGYDPPCGVCEGTGGIPTADENSAIRLTTCIPATQVNASTVKRPIFASKFHVEEYFEVLIGVKKDPACFQSFPGNDSIGPLCYRPQQGSQDFDSEGKFGLRYDVVVKTIVGNVTSTVIHKDEKMWIVNHFPWYAGHLKQCICTEPRQGGDWTTPKVYPITFNWTNHLRYVGREILGIEYIWKTETVDHWAFGPHHVWTIPDSGQILRMWQPFNGLEVFPKGLNPGDVDPSKFADIPPTVCTKHAPLGTIRVKCTDDGNPVPHPTALVADGKDLKRARTKVPRSHFKGTGFARMSGVLNGWLAKDGAVTQPCDNFTATDLQRLQAQLYLLRNEDLEKIYRDSSDNRRLRNSVDELTQLWSEQGLRAFEHGLADMHRDGHCHEAVMWYVHHLDEDSKQALRAAKVSIPLLPTAQHSCPEGATEAQLSSCKSYEEQVSCLSCHADVYPTKQQEVIV